MSNEFAAVDGQQPAAVLDSATILLVEDNPALIEGIRDLLEVTHFGYDLRVITATDGQAGLEAVQANEPDLIISDIMMPKMDGFEFLKRVRENPRWVHIPVIFLTAKGTDQDILEGRRSGAELYITKPFDSQALMELVKTQLDRALSLERVREKDLGVLKQNIMQILNHEFRTPLTYVTAYYEMLAASVEEPEYGDDLQMYLQGIQAGAVRLSRLVDDLIKVLELHSGEMESRFRQQAQTFDTIGELFRSVGLAHEARAAEHEISISYDIPEPSPPIYGDPEYLLEVFDRLLNNAIKFTRLKWEGARRIELRMALNDTAAEGFGAQEVVLSVKDNGVGFPERVRHQIFEPFVQFNRSELEQQGSGSGLAIARGLVEVHQGHIEVSSEEDVGSTFSVHLPLQRATGEARPPNEAIGTVGSQWPAIIDAASSTDATVLIVEDDIYLLEGLRDILEAMVVGYDLRVLTAPNVHRALEMLGQTQVDLIISDITMPGLDGYDFLERVRRNPTWTPIPFIFLTARGDAQDRHRGLRSGVAEYIAKPYDSKVLVELVTSQLRRYFEVQRVVHQNFEHLKRSILNLLRPDFRQPLSLVTRESQKLAEGLQEAETEQDLKLSLRSLQESSNHLAHLVDDFIALAELRTGQAAANYARRATVVEQPHTLLLESIQDRAAATGQANVELHNEAPTDLPPVICHTTLLVNAIGRLIDAAVYHAVAGGAPDVYLDAGYRAGGGDVRFTVRQKGRGFSKEAAEKLQALFRDEADDALGLGDEGAGLTIVKEIVDLHDGSIELENAEDEGCAFTIALPVYRTGNRE